MCLARALVVRPQLLILDEAVSNLDLMLQADIIALLKRLQAQFATACLFITHDLRLVERFCQRVLVMDSGRIVRNGRSEFAAAPYIRCRTGATARGTPALSPHSA